MASQITGSSEVAVHVYQALYGQAPGNALYTSYIAQIGTTDGFAWANQMASGFSTLSDSDFATLILGNMGISATTLTTSTVTPTVTGAIAYAALQGAVANYLTSVGVASRGTVVAQLSEIVSNLAGTTDVYGAAATTYNTQALADFNHATTAGSVSGVAALPDATIGTTFPLTVGADTFVGTALNDTFNAGTADTLSAFDSLTGGLGTDTLNVLFSTATAMPGLTTITGIENITINTAGLGFTIDATPYTGVTQLSVADSGATGALSVTAPVTTAVAASSAGTGGTTVVGGLSQTVTAVGGVALSGSAGAISAASTATAAAASSITGGTSVTYTSTGATTGAITVGSATKAPTGAVAVTETHAFGVSDTGGAIAVTGGTTVSVTQAGGNATATVTGTAVQSAVTVTGSAVTTGVTVTQAAPVTQVPLAAVTAAVQEVQTVTVGNGAVTGPVQFLGVQVAGSYVGDTDAETAAKIVLDKAAIIAGATAAGLGITDISATGAVLSITYASAKGDVANFSTISASTTTGGASFTYAANTATGVIGTAAKAAVAGLTDGAVTITDVNAASLTAAGHIASVSLTNFGVATANSSALSSVTLSGVGTSFAQTSGALTTATLTTETLNVVDFTAGTVDLSAVPTTIAIVSTSATATGTNTVTSLTAAGATAVNISGDKGLTITAHSFDAAAVITSASTGAVTITGTLLAGQKYTGGAGIDTITVPSGSTTAIDTGAGNDVVTYGGAAGTGGSIAAGDGTTDTISMTAAAAATATGSTTFASKVSGFEVLSVSDASAGQTIDMLNADGINSVTVAVAGTGVAITDAAANFTLTQKGALTTSSITLLDASGASDVVNVAYSSSGAGSAAWGSTTINGVETLHITTVDSSATTANTGNFTSTIIDTAAKAVTVAGAFGVNLTLASTALTSFDASGVTGTGNAGAVTYTTGALAAAATLTGGAGTNVINASATSKAMTITGGAGLDNLIGGSGADVINGGNGGTTGSGLVGGAGADTITGGTGTDLFNGGTGADVFTTGGGKDTFFLANATDTGLLPSIAGVDYGAIVTPGSFFSTGAMDKINGFVTGDAIITSSGLSSSTVVTNANAVNAVWTNTQGFLRGNYDATNDVFTLAAAGTSSLYVFDADGLTTTTIADLYGIVLVGYVDGASDTFGGLLTTGLIAVA